MDQEQPEKEDFQKLEKKEAEDHDYSDIKLRLLDLLDIDDFMAWATDDAATKFYDYSDINSREAAANYIVDRVIPHPWFRAICLKDRPIGEIQVRTFWGNDSCRAEIGFVLASKYWGKGIATMAVKMVASTIFLEWPHLARLEALVDVENPRSYRVLEKAGFQKEGVLRKYCLLKGKPRDMVMFSLLPTDLNKYFDYVNS